MRSTRYIMIRDTKASVLVTKSLNVICRRNMRPTHHSWAPCSSELNLSVLIRNSFLLRSFQLRCNRGKWYHCQGWSEHLEVSPRSKSFYCWIWRETGIRLSSFKHIYSSKAWTSILISSAVWETSARSPINLNDTLNSKLWKSRLAALWPN